MECHFCKGDLKSGRTTYTVNRNGYHLLVDDVPAWIWQQCGRPAFEEKVVEVIRRFLTTIDEGVALVRQKLEANDALFFGCWWNREH